VFDCAGVAGGEQTGDEAGDAERGKFEETTGDSARRRQRTHELSSRDTRFGAG
jgi:hypothetical protein